MKVVFLKKHNERVVPIDGYEGLFSVTDHGKVLSYPKVQNGNKLIERKQVIDNRGYLRVSLGKDYIKTAYKVHRLVAFYFIDNPNNLPEVNHKDGNKFNNHYKNLEWSSRKGNMEHASRTGLLCVRRGSENSQSLLTEKQALEIFKSSAAPKKICKRFGVSIYCVYDIRTGRSWCHVTGLKHKSRK